MIEVVYVDSSGNTRTQTYFSSEEYIRQRIEADGGFVISVKRKKLIYLSKKASSEEICVIFEALADLLDSGVALSKALEIVANQASGKLKPVLVSMSESIQRGENFSEVIGNYTDIFGSAVVEILRSGYETGKLSDTLRLAVNYLSQTSEITKEFLSKMSYPLLVLVLGIFAVFFNSYVIVPKILKSGLFDVVKSSGSAVKAMNLLLFMSKVIPIIVILLLLSVLVMIVFYITNREKAERIYMRFPFFREFFFYRAFFIVFYSLSQLIKSGVRLSVAFEIVSQSVRLKILQESLKKAKEMLESGESYVPAFVMLSDVDRAILEMAISEEKIASAFEKVAMRCYREFVRKLRGLAPKLYAVVLILVLGIFFAVFMAIIVPYVQLLSKIGSGGGM